jgi:mannose-6-phosphate isomerase-like protein (cupin superfamily)
MKLHKSNAEHYIWGGSCDGWKLVDEPERSMIHERMPPGTSETKHYHQKAKQFFFMLSGTAAMYVNDERIELKAHEGIAIEPGVAHRMTNESEEDTEFLVISTPTSAGDRIRC